MAKIPQSASLDVQVAIRELNDEIVRLKKDLVETKKQIPSPQAVEQLQGAVTRLSKTPTYLDPNDVFRKSGPPHMHGYVPDPGPTPGTGKFLREDATWAVAGGGPPGPHTHPSEDITHVGSGYIAANDVKEAIEELDNEKLARSGAQDMLGNLDMGGNEIGDLKNLLFTGGVGAAFIDAVRTIYMTGAGEVFGVKLIEFDPTEPSTLIRYLDTIEFDKNPVHSPHVEGSFHWDNSTAIKMPVADVAGDVQLPLASVYMRVINHTGFTISAGVPVSWDGTSIFGTVSVARTSNDTTYFLGLTAADIANDDFGWVCVKGSVKGSFGYLGGGYIYLDNGLPRGLTTNPPGAEQKGCTDTVRVGYVQNDDVFFVDIDRQPALGELSDVNVNPICGDVLVRHVNPGSGCEQWTASGLWTEVELDFGLTDREERVFTIGPDIRVKSPSDLITMVSSSVPPTGREEDEAEFDAFACACSIPYEDQTNEWKFRATIHSLRGPVVGSYKFNYTVSNPASWNCVPPGEPQ
jgi:hypothetical protein